MSRAEATRATPSVSLGVGLKVHQRRDDVARLRTRVGEQLRANRYPPPATAFIESLLRFLDGTSLTS